MYIYICMENAKRNWISEIDMYRYHMIYIYTYIYILYTYSISYNRKSQSMNRVSLSTALALGAAQEPSRGGKALVGEKKTPMKSNSIKSHEIPWNSIKKIQVNSMNKIHCKLVCLQCFMHMFSLKKITLPWGAVQSVEKSTWNPIVSPPPAPSLKTAPDECAPPGGTTELS